MSTDPIDPALVTRLNSFAVAATPAALVFLGVTVGARWWRRSRPWVAVSQGLAALAGIALGAAAVVGGPLAPVLDASGIFGIGPEWNLSGAALVEQRFPEALAGLGGVLRSPLAMLPHPVDRLVHAFIACAALALLLPFVGLTPRQAIANATVGVGVAAFTALAVVYLACFGPWILNVLNFWALGVLLVLFVYWRHGTL